MSRRMGRMLAATLAAGLALSAGAAAAAPIGMLKQFKVPTANSLPRAITTDSDGNRWFTESDENHNFAKIARITSTGAITEFTPVADDGCSACGISDIAQGPDGILYITNNSRQLMRFNESTENFVRPPVTIPAPTDNLDNLAVSATDVWITQTFDNRVFRYRISDGQITSFIVTSPGDVAVDKDGNAWVTERGTDSIVRIDATTGAITKTLASDGNNTVEPVHITVAADGQVWFTSQVSPAAVGRLTPATNPDNNSVTLLKILADGPIPEEIAASPGGGVWFTQEIKGNIANIGNDGVLTESKVVKGSGPFGITVAPDGNPWYTMKAANKVATLQLR